MKTYYLVITIVLVLLAACATTDETPTLEPSITAHTSKSEATIAPTLTAPSLEQPSEGSEVVLEPRRVPVAMDEIEIVSSNRAVHQLAFDDNGVLWAKTDSGAVRWDISTGTYEVRDPDIQIFLPDEMSRLYEVMQEGLVGDDYLMHYAVSPDGTEWFAGSGVYHLDGEELTHFTVEDGLASNLVSTMAIGPDNVVWVGDYGMTISRFDGESWTAYDGVPENFEYIIADAEGNLWIAGQYAGIHRFDGRTWVDLTNEEWEYFTLHIDNTDHVWIETQTTVYRWQDGTLLPYPLVDAQGQMPEGYGISLNTILVTLDGTVWMGFMVDLTTEGFGGLARLQDEELIWYSEADGLQADHVVDIVDGPDGTIWMATPNGISGFDGLRWQSLVVEEGPPFSSVEHVTLGPDGNFWFLAENGSLFNYDGLIWQEIPNTDWSPNVSSSHRLYGGEKDITTSPDGNIVVASCGGLFHIEDGAWVADEAVWAPNSCIEYGCLDNVSAGPDGNVWLVLRVMYDYGYTAVHFDGDNFKQYVADVFYLSYPFGCGETIEGKFPPESEEVYDVAAGLNGSAYIVTDTGLTYYDGIQWTTFDSDVISDQELGPVMTDPEGNLWMGGSSGFAFYNGTIWKKYKIDEPGDSDFYTTPVMIADDGTLWMSIIDLSAESNYPAYSIGHFDGHLLTLYDFDLEILPYYLDFAVGPDGNLWLVGGSDNAMIHYKLPNH